jgi:hypothetical protein
MFDANHGKRVQGEEYISFLTRLHASFNPSTYFEIGVQFGTSLKIARCDSIAVDPVFVCDADVIGRKPACHFFQQTSDSFFESKSPIEILGGPIDFAFLDGLHWFDFLLRDFINTEQHCSANSLIVLHDCLPPGFYMTSRDINDANHPQSAFQGWWSGDVWKMVPTLQRHRPDLDIKVIDCAPTGLVIVSGLDPKSTVLASQYASIIEEFELMSRRQFDDYWRGVYVTRAADIHLSQYRAR